MKCEKCGKEFVGSKNKNHLLCFDCEWWQNQVYESEVKDGY